MCDAQHLKQIKMIKIDSKAWLQNFGKKYGLLYEAKNFILQFSSTGIIRFNLIY